jgi:hypothetical protein
VANAAEIWWTIRRIILVSRVLGIKGKSSGAGAMSKAVLLLDAIEKIKRFIYINQLITALTCAARAKCKGGI